MEKLDFMMLRCYELDMGAGVTRTSGGNMYSAFESY